MKKVEIYCAQIGFVDSKQFKGYHTPCHHSLDLCLATEKSP